MEIYNPFYSRKKDKLENNFRKSLDVHLRNQQAFHTLRIGVMWNKEEPNKGYNIVDRQSINILQSN